MGIGHASDQKKDWPRFLHSLSRAESKILAARECAFLSKPSAESLVRKCAVDYKSLRLQFGLEASPSFFPQKGQQRPVR